MTTHPIIGSIWRHADGGTYRVLDNRGQVKVGKGKWYPAIRYDHDDGTLSMGPYTTDEPRFLKRFTPV